MHAWHSDNMLSIKRVASFQEYGRTKKHTQRQEIEQLKHTFFGFKIEKKNAFQCLIPGIRELCVHCTLRIPNESY